MTRAALTVTKLNAYVAQVLSRDAILRNLRIQGEISGFKCHSSGHWYFLMKDEASCVRCVMFYQQNQRMDFRPRDGMQVEIEGYAALYERDGQFQIYVQNMQECGRGDLYHQFMLLKEKLEQKGYFSPERKRAIPFLPKCVGVVTSATGAAIQDITNVITRRYPNMNIVVCPVKVQGVGAAEDIADGIRHLNDLHQVDVMIVGRGGGSMEDLWAFNEMPVVQAIYDSKIPVISAVGHEIDFTLADFVADVRAATPSAAAELCVPEYDACVQRLDLAAERIGYAFRANITAKRSALQQAMHDRAFVSIKGQIAKDRQHIDAIRTQMEMTMRTRMEIGKLKLKTLRDQIQSMGPESVLQRGYAIIQNEYGQAVTSIVDLYPDTQVSIRMQDGTAHAAIRSVDEKRGM